MRKKAASLYLIICLALIVSERVVAQGRALVIGNSNYEVGALKNAASDAKAVAHLLQEELGFEVELLLNADRRSMFLAVQRFRRSLRAGDIALFYFAGHGIEAERHNYLLPVNNRSIALLEDVPIESISAQSVLQHMEASSSLVNIMILDACRDSPLPASERGSSRGLAPMQVTRSSMVAFATQPGRIALDGEGLANSPYTTALLRHLTTPGASLLDIFNRIGLEVAESTEGKQIPSIEVTPLPNVFLSRSEDRFELQPSQNGKVLTEEDINLFNQALKFSSTTAFNEYLNKFQNGHFKDSAISMLNRFSAIVGSVNTHWSFSIDYYLESGEALDYLISTEPVELSRNLDAQNPELIILNEKNINAGDILLPEKMHNIMYAFDHDYHAVFEGYKDRDDYYCNNEWCYHHALGPADTLKFTELGQLSSGEHVFMLIRTWRNSFYNNDLSLLLTSKLNDNVYRLNGLINLDGSMNGNCTSLPTFHDKVHVSVACWPSRRNGQENYTFESYIYDIDKGGLSVVENQIPYDPETAVASVQLVIKLDYYKACGNGFDIDINQCYRQFFHEKNIVYAFGYEKVRQAGEAITRTVHASTHCSSIDEWEIILTDSDQLMISCQLERTFLGLHSFLGYEFLPVNNSRLILTIH